MHSQSSTRQHSLHLLPDYKTPPTSPACKKVMRVRTAPGKGPSDELQMRNQICRAESAGAPEAWNMVSWLGQVYIHFWKVQPRGLPYTTPLGSTWTFFSENLESR